MSQVESHAAAWQNRSAKRELISATVAVVCWQCNTPLMKRDIAEHVRTTNKNN
jgi:hypothetical protein